MIEAPFEVGRMLGRLNDADLPYVVVGGIAVIVHGYVRPTEDLDVLVPERREIGEALQALLAAWDATRLDGSALPDALFSGRRGRSRLTPPCRQLTCRPARRAASRPHTAPPRDRP